MRMTTIAVLSSILPGKMKLGSARTQTNKEQPCQDGEIICGPGAQPPPGFVLGLMHFFALRCLGKSHPASPDAPIPRQAGGELTAYDELRR